MILAIEVSISLFKISHHFVGPFEKEFILDFFQYLMHWLSEYSPDHLIVIWPWLLCIIPSRPIIVVSVQPKISSFLRDNLSFSFPLLLIVFYPLILVNSIHQLSQIGDRLTRQGFSQTMFGWEADLKSSNSDFIKIAINFIEHLPIPFSICLPRLPFPHCHIQQRI